MLWLHLSNERKRYNRSTANGFLKINTIQEFRNSSFILVSVVAIEINKAEADGCARPNARPILGPSKTDRMLEYRCVSMSVQDFLCCSVASAAFSSLILSLSLENLNNRRCRILNQAEPTRVLI
jgi:hypothetical protein